MNIILNKAYNGKKLFQIPSLEVDTLDLLLHSCTSCMPLQSKATSSTTDVCSVCVCLRVSIVITAMMLSFIFRPTYCIEFLPAKSRAIIFCLLQVSDHNGSH